MATFVRGSVSKLPVRYVPRGRHAKTVVQLVIEPGGGGRRHTHTPVDAAGMRGVPILGPGFAGGAIRGTRPGDGLFR